MSSGISSVMRTTVSARLCSDPQRRWSSYMRSSLTIQRLNALLLQCNSGSRWCRICTVSTRSSNSSKHLSVDSTAIHRPAPAEISLSTSRRSTRPARRTFNYDHYRGDGHCPDEDSYSNTDLLEHLWCEEENAAEAEHHRS
jgi:hypothetical protein